MIYYAVWSGGCLSVATAVLPALLDIIRRGCMACKQFSYDIDDAGKEKKNGQIRQLQDGVL